jgi:exodeoxyribonuclease VII large subunit
MSKKENFITVSDLNNIIRDTLVEKFSSQLKVKGELSNIKISGQHTYLTLKDSNSSINVVAWNTKFQNINNGDDVMVTGKIACYVKGGTYQLSVSKIDKIGIGHLHEILEENKKLFLEKGYFTKSQVCLPLPDIVKSIGILTASEGAALHDILYVLKKNMFHGKVYIKNCSVQGQLCPQSVSNGITFFNNLNKKNHVDILIVSRGGGSFEDLIGYSSKEIVKAIYKTSIYTISAVGHEVDTMLSDFSADYRAPTPSIAAEVVSCTQKKRKEELGNNLAYIQTLKIQIINKLENYKESLKSSSKILNTLNPENYLINELNKFERIRYDFHNTINNVIEKHKNELEKNSTKNESFNPAQTFENGYVAIVDEQNNLINTLNMFNEHMATKQKLKIVFIDGEIDIPINLIKAKK